MDEFVPTRVFERMVVLRRDLHRHPELSSQEHETAGRIEHQLRQLGLEPYRLAATGVVADLPGAQSGPAIALRADTDALPVQEETGLEFTSTRPGVMHACGHDAHSSMLIGAAELLLSGDPPPLPVRFVWQPAEETGRGAKAMIEAGVLDGVGMIFGGHVDRRYAADVLIVTPGPVNAATDAFEVEFTGSGGHSARPHEALDAVVVGSLFVTAIQTIVSREVDPAHPSVVTIGTFNAGTAPNVIAAKARLEGRIRAQDEGVRSLLAESIERIARAIAQLHQAQVSVELQRGLPPLVNTPEMTELARDAAIEVVGPERVVPLHTLNMGGEDFACYLEHVPGCYIRYGCQVPGQEGFPAHSSRFDVDERALAAGAAWLARVARRAGERLAGDSRSAGS